MIANILKKKKYLNCLYMKHSLHFFYDEIMACCTNIPGFILLPDYNGEKIDWDYVYKKRKDKIKQINSFFNKQEIPECCKGCCEVGSFLQDRPVEPFENRIDKLYFHNNMSCNAKCVYCTYEYLGRGYKYKVLPLVKDLINKKILDICAHIYMSGGEITISPEFEELLSLLLGHVYSRIEILTSGIKYCKSIERAFVENKCELMISLDSSDRDVYKKIKRVDCFDKVVDNIKSYIKASDNAKNGITLKYIIVDGINDNIEEIEKFVKLVSSLEIMKIRLDFDYEKYKFTGNIPLPKHYFELYDKFNELALKDGLDIQKCDQIEAILNKNKNFYA